MFQYGLVHLCDHIPLDIQNPVDSKWEESWSLEGTFKAATPDSPCDQPHDQEHNFW